MQAKILVVDDHAANLLAIEAVLEPLGHTMLKAKSGEEALRLLLDHDVALILMDVQMPGLDGFRTVQLIKERERSRVTPVIFLTAINKEAAHVARGYDTGAVDYIFKPFDADILRAKVAVFLELHLTKQRLIEKEIELRKAERVAHEAAMARRFRSLTDAMPQCVWATRRDGSVYYVNRTARAYLGKVVAASSEYRIGDLCHPEDEARVRDAWTRCMREAREWETAFRMRAEDGSYRWFLGRAVPERDDDRGVTGFIITATDIDDLRRAMEAKDVFLAAASHELRTPLAAARAQAELARRWLERQEGGDPRTHRAVDTTCKQIERMGHLVENLLDVGRIQNGRLSLEMSTFDLKDVLEECCDRARALATNHTIELHAQASASMLGDRSRLDQVFTNILSNALRYSPDGGPVVVELVADGDHVLTRVRDQGVGIPVSMQKEIFERFGRAHGSRFGGLGLGLTIAHGIVEQHGGAIHVASTGVPGEGTTFEVVLPKIGAVVPERDATSAARPD
ncbi:MAG: ATP-binding protein [Polyangiales bacterium]